MFRLILAADEEGGIGKDGSIPWMCKGDLAFFREKTLGKTIIMGRKTFESFKNPLPQREMFVTQRPNTDVTQCERGSYIIGGAIIAKALWDQISVIYLTHIPGTYGCDTFLPEPLLTMSKSIRQGIPVEGCRQIRNDPTFQVFRIERRNSDEELFQSLLRSVHLRGLPSPDRTGVGRRCLFGKSLHFSLEDNVLPISTLRKSPIRHIFEELMWFLRGSTNAKELQAKGVKIWNGNSSKEALQELKLDYEEGECGPIYGHQWRKWGGDQIQTIINQLKTNPESARIILSAWNVEDLPKMCLPPCHVMYQFRVSRKKYLHCILSQRSSDIALAGMWNVTSASLLTILLAKVTGLEPGSLTWNVGDVHIYENQDVLEILRRTPKAFPTIKVSEVKEIDTYRFEDLQIEGYQSHPPVSLPMNV